MTHLLDSDIVTAIVRRNGQFTWFRSPSDFWVMDWVRWHQSFADLGCTAPELNESDRLGILVVNCETAEAFLQKMTQFSISKQTLQAELMAKRLQSNSWWDMADLFPVVLVDFDHQKLSAVYGEGTRYELYAPSGWVGEFIDFYNQYPEQLFPASEKFWVIDGVDTLKTLES